MVRRKILHIIATLEIGGAEVQLINLIRNLNRNNYASMVCCIARGGPLVAELKELGIKVVILGKERKLNPSVLLPLYRLIKNERIDIVHTQMFRANLWGRIAAILAGVPVIIATEHGLNPWKNFIHITVNRILAEFTDGIISVSAVGRRIRIQREGIKPEKIVTIHNCVDLRLFDRAADFDNNIRQEFSIGSDECVVGVVGRLQEVKGIRYLIEAVADLRQTVPTARLLVVGDGPFKQSLMNLVQKLGLDEQVIFTGYRRDIPQMMNTMDVFVLPSLREDLPLSLIEAMAMRKPVVATSVGGIPEVVVDGETGILVPPKDSTTLAKAIAQILLDKQLASHMGLAGRRRVENQFSVDAVVERTQQIYNRLIRKKIGREY